MTVDKLNRAYRKALKRTTTAERRLARAYQRAIREAARIIANNYISAATPHAITASEWQWGMPDLDELFTRDDLARLLEERTASARAEMLHEATADLFAAFALEPNIRESITLQVTRLLGQRITNVSDSIRNEAGSILRSALDQGLSIPNSAELLSSRLSLFSIARSTMIARTEMIGAANSASLGAAQATGAASHKTWMATQDERTRDTHAEADGQTVMVDDPFVVGGAELMYPGDEEGPPEEVVNCRCTLVYADEPGAVVGGVMDDVVAAASGASDLPLGDREAAWDSAAAKRRVRAWATSGGNLDLDKYARAFFWRPGGADETASGFKLPFADVRGGSLEAQWGGVTGAAAAVQGSRGGVDLPSGDVSAVKSRIAGYYTKAADAYDDPSIKPPWSADVEELAETEVFRGQMTFVTAISEVGACTRFRALLAPIGTPTDDGRMLDPAEAGAIGWRECPLTLMAQFETAPGHDGAKICGAIDQIEVGYAEAGSWTGQGFVCEGHFDDAAGGSDAGIEAARMCRTGMLTGVSVDLAVHEAEMRGPDGSPMSSEEGMLDAMLGGDAIMCVTRGSIMGATLTPFPAFAEATVEIVASLAHADALLANRPNPEPDPDPDEEPAEEVVVELRGVASVARGAIPSLAEVDALAALVGLGLASVNDVRGFIGLDRLAHGDDLMPLRITDRLDDDDRREERAALAASLGAVAAVLSDQAILTSSVTDAAETVRAARDALTASVEAITESTQRKPRKLSVVRDDDGRAVRYEEE